MRRMWGNKNAHIINVMLDMECRERRRERKREHGDVPTKSIARFNFNSILSSTLIAQLDREPQFLKIQLFFFVLSISPFFVFIILFAFPGWKMMSKHNSLLFFSLSFSSLFYLLLFFGCNSFGVSFLFTTEEMSCIDLNKVHLNRSAQTSSA